MKTYHNGYGLECTRSGQQIGDQSWQQFVKTVGWDLPYPENILILYMLGKQSGMEYISGTTEQKADMLAGMRWAIGSLPESMQLVLAGIYRDHLSVKDYAAKNGMPVSEVTRLRSIGRNRLRKPVRFAAIQCGMSKYAESLPALGAAGEALRNKIRSGTIHADGFSFYRFRYIDIRHLGLSLDSITLLLRNDISNTSGLLDYLKEHTLSDLPGITEEVEQDIQDALAFISRHSYTLLNK